MFSSKELSQETSENRALKVCYKMISSTTWGRGKSFHFLNDVSNSEFAIGILSVWAFFRETRVSAVVALQGARSGAPPVAVSVTTSAGLEPTFNHH